MRLTGDLQSTRLRYEDLVASPQPVLGSLLAELGIGDATLPAFPNPGDTVLGPTALVTAMTWPFLMGYGYPLGRTGTSTHRRRH